MDSKILYSILVGAVLLSGCYVPPQVLSSKIDTPAYTFQFHADDFHIGDIVSSEMPYMRDDDNLHERLFNKAITDHRCDTLLMPRYEVILDRGTRIIRITGRAATLKKR